MVIGLLKGKKKDPGEIIVHGPPRLGMSLPAPMETLPLPSQREPGIGLPT